MKELFYVVLVAMIAVTIASPIRNIVDGLSRPKILVFINDPK